MALWHYGGPSPALSMELSYSRSIQDTDHVPLPVAPWWYHVYSCVLSLKSLGTIFSLALLVT